MEQPKIAFVCKYSAICNRNCEKCQHLKELQIMDLTNMVVPTYPQELTCDCM